jgi:predicted nucleotidyltransferase component of viral defense system
MKNILTERQLAFLDAIRKEPSFAKQFCLTGGTALAGFYLFHRYSEDLDFFCEEEFDAMTIDIFLKKTVQPLLGVTSIDFQQSFNRNLFFLHFSDGEVLKTEFTYFPFPRLDTSVHEDGLQVESKIDLAVNKLFTIYQRTAARDYIDLYCLCRKEGYEISELLKKARIKFDWHIDPLQLGTQFIKADEASDFPRMIEDFPPEEWRTFYREEAKKLKPEIFEA